MHTTPLTTAQAAPAAQSALRYDDEVLNANWLPQAMLHAADETEPRPSRTSSGVADPDTFLQRLYQAQE